MAIKTTIHPFGEITFRQVRFIAAELVSMGYRNEQANKENFISSVMGNLANNEELAEQILGKFRQQALPDELLKWITQDNPRLCYWIQAYLFNDPRIAYPDINISTSPYTGVDNTILAFDLSPLPNKKNMLEEMKNLWSIIFNNQKRHKWIDPKNTTQIDWLWDYLNKKINLISPPPITDEKDKYTVLVGYFDLNYNNFEFIYHIDKSKQAWSQKKHRDKREGKKAYNFVLSDESKTKLNAIAAHKDQKINETLEKLINKVHAELNL